MATDFRTVSPPQWVKHQREAEFTATRWWRCVLADGTLWKEASDEAEVKTDVPPGARVQRLYERCAQEWRDEA